MRQGPFPWKTIQSSKNPSADKARKPYSEFLITPKGTNPKYPFYRDIHPFLEFHCMDSEIAPPEKGEGLGSNRENIA
jgi:hypothetical protein